MILECAGCTKMFRVRDDASPLPSKCPTCGGVLRPAGGPPSKPGAPRSSELETKVEQLARERDEAQERASALERELESARSRPALSAETLPGVSGLADQVAELRAAAQKADGLDRDLADLRSESERNLREKDREAVQAREERDREAGERRRAEARLNGLEETHAKTLEGRDKTIQSIDASLASYRSKVEGLQKKVDSLELQRLTDLNSFDQRLRERERSDRGEIDRQVESHQKALTDLRVELEAKVSDKDRQITEGRQNLDREAGERRRLGEALARIEESSKVASAEKEASLSALQATLDSYKSKLDTLQARLAGVEQNRRSDQDGEARRVRFTQAVRARVEEAGHLVIDVDHSLDGIEASLSTLRDRLKRLKGALQETEGEPTPASPSYGSAASFDTRSVEEPAKPELSQADPWGAGPATEPEPELAPIELASTAAIAPPPPPEAPESAPVDLESVEPLRDVALSGRSDEPSSTWPTVPEAALAASAAEPSDDIPLISPPEEAAPAPVAEQTAPKPAADTGTKRRFSWQRK